MGQSKDIDISKHSSSTKLKLNDSTKINAWLSLPDTSPWRATNSEECDVVRRNRYFCFLAGLASLLLKPWCTMIELGDTTRPAVCHELCKNKLGGVRKTYSELLILLFYLYLFLSNR